jgi:hypothetical protein
MELLILFFVTVIYRGTFMTQYQQMVRRQEKEAQKAYLSGLREVNQRFGE